MYNADSGIKIHLLMSYVKGFEKYLPIFLEAKHFSICCL